MFVFNLDCQILWRHFCEGAYEIVIIAETRGTKHVQRYIYLLLHSISFVTFLDEYHNWWLNVTCLITSD